MKIKYIEMTGNTKPYFKTKEMFLEALRPYGFEHGKITKRNNIVTILVTNDSDSKTAKMLQAGELGVEIMTYLELGEMFGII